MFVKCPSARPRCACGRALDRSEEHTSELQSRSDLVCRLLLEKKNKREALYQRHRAMWTYHFKHHAQGVSAFGNGLVWGQIWGRWLEASVRDSVMKSSGTPCEH